MTRKLVILLIILAFGIFFTGKTFSQETEEGKETVEITEDTTEGTTEGAAEGEKTATDAAAEKPAPVLPSEKAKTFNDGVDTYVNSKVKFKLSVTDNFLAEKIVYQVNGGAETEFAGEFNLSDEGKYTINYYGIDKIGNKEYQQAFRVVVDNSAPVVNINTATPIIQKNGVNYISRNNSFTIFSEDKLSGVNNIAYTINGTDFINYATTFNFYVDGETEFKLSASDNVTNKTDKFFIKVGEQPATELSSLKLFVDNTPPAVMIKADKPFFSNNGRKVASKDFKYAVTAEDKESGLSKILVKLDGKGTFQPLEAEKEITFTTNGEHFIEAKAVDAVGNVSNTVILSLYVDIIPPKSKIEAITD